MIMNEFGYITVTRVHAAEQQIRLDQALLVRPADRKANERRAREGAASGTGPVQRLKQWARTLDARPGRRTRLSRTAASRAGDTRG